ncbi:MAG TPA: uroporphyrinogen-III synthase [Vicinamibacterales bacterium]|nr:uroporphyrinogen-III synthase [Vicinamibacterales bacterium]
MSESLPTFDNLRVLILESRRAREMASIVTSYGGQPITAPSMREVPLESNPQAMAFADALERNQFDVVVLLTGVGTRALVAVVEGVRGTREPFVDALRRTRVVARGPKPVAVLRELNVPIWLIAPEPNTWREVLAVLDTKQSELSLDGRHVAVQEYGAPNLDLVAGLEARGAHVTRVPVYQWALPDDLGPLKAGIQAIVDRQVDVVLFTTATQVVHLLQVAEMMGSRDAVREGLGHLVVASIGPTTSEELREQGIRPDFEPSHPKMGFLVREAAERAKELLKGKAALS